MRLTLLPLGFVALALGIAGHAFGSPPRDVADAALGFAAACAAAVALARHGAGASTLRGKRNTAPMRVIGAGLCPACSRPLPRGLKQCPFCNPIFTPGLRIEETAEVGNVPRELIPMPGLALAEKLRTEARARGYLHVVQGESRGQSLLLTTSAVTIGRGLDNTLVLKDAAVSERHAELRPSREGFVVRDLESRNGTFVNEARADKAGLHAGDIIRLGATLIFVSFD
jgi:hypothetical protein